MDGPGRLGRLRRRLIHGQLRPMIEPDEDVLVWAHVHAPHGRGHGVLALTGRRCLLHWGSGGHAAAAIPWEDLRAWRLRHDGSRPAVVLEAGDTKVEARLPTSSRARVRRARAVLRSLGEHAPGGCADAAEDRGGAVDLQAERRGIRGHTRRVGVTVLGLAIILLGLLFASPFLPGPGTLTVLGGLAVLASEYDGAREIQQWLKRKAARFLSRRRRRTAGGDAVPEPAPLATAGRGAGLSAPARAGDGSRRPGS